jgi:hypothetical protein
VRVEPGRFILTVKNTGRPIVLELLGRPPAADFVVENTDGEEVWRPLRLKPNEGFPDILAVRSLGPGETIKFDAEHALPAGSYTVRGILPSTGNRCLEAGPEAFDVG